MVYDHEKLLAEVLDRHPILLDEDFSNRHPHVVNFAVFLYSGSRKNPENYEPFKRVGVSSLEEFLSELERGNKLAIKEYIETVSLLF